MANKLGTKKSKFKIQRSLLIELPGLGKAGAMERRAYPPGQHGHRRRKLSEYGLKLREKQKLKFHYGLREEQLTRLARKAKKQSSGAWVSDLVGMLECRLDNFVFRMGWARSTLAARQLVSHGHVLVDGKRVNVSSYTLKLKQVVTLKAAAAQTNSVMHSLKDPRLPLPDYLDSMEAKEGALQGTISAMPNGSHIPFDFDAQAVTEYFSKLK